MRDVTLRGWLLGTSHPKSSFNRGRAWLRWHRRFGLLPLLRLVSGSHGSLRIATLRFDRYEVSVRRDGEGQPVYVSVACECAWEPEHGLQIVFRDGARVTRVGPFDGHLTNASAYGRDDLQDVIYVR